MKFYRLKKPFKTKDLSKQIESSRLSFASSHNMEKYLDITPGSVSVLGLMNDKENAVSLLVDKDLMTEDYIGGHPCINTSSLKIKTEDVFEQVEIDLKYEGYIKRQQAKVDEMRRLEVKKIPADIDYDDVYSLRLEAREKLKKVRPQSVGQASRISGVSPSDISVLLIHLSKNKN